MNLFNVKQQLIDGPVTFVAHGNSMTPLIKSGDTVTVSPVDPGLVVKGDIVLAKVRGHLYLHLVLATDKHRVKIGNNHGHVNGWTNRSNIFGRLGES